MITLNKRLLALLGGEISKEHFVKDNQKKVNFVNSNEIPNELVLDSQWEDIYGSSRHNMIIQSAK